MNRDESIKLWQQGKEAWNEWAEKMLAERKELEESGKWQAEKDIFGETKGKNKTTRNWLDRAGADFSNLRLRADVLPEVGEIKDRKKQTRKSILVDGENVDFSDFIFPAHVTFSNTIFDCGAADFGYSQFRGAADFGFSQFRGDAHFGSSHFRGAAYFWSSRFREVADFGSSRFLGFADFGSSRFRGVADFRSSQFRGVADFGSSRFLGFADFGSSQFLGDADFGSSQFRGDADFNLAHFIKPVFFKKAIFRKAADFSSITSEKSFNLFETRFTQVPDFNETAFHAPPVLDDMKVAGPLKRREWRFHAKNEKDHSRDIRPHIYIDWPLARAADETRKYRALSKMASEAKDYQNEMEFFAQEQRCRRFWHDRPWGKTSGRFWIGWLYDKLSNYGRSFWRPVVGWLATWAAFAVFFASTVTKDGAHFNDPLYISLRHGLIISGLTRNGHLKQVLDRMYGAEHIPDAASYAMLTQPLVSAIWLFLLLLALRNQFKIR
jgi:uncharacterized protein YjbI with pentapeptide repeats